MIVKAYPQLRFASRALAPSSLRRKYSIYPNAAHIHANRRYLFFRRSFIWNAVTMSGNAMERKLTGIRYPVCAVIALPGAITMPEPPDPPPKREPFWSSITIKDGMTDDAKTRSLGTGAFLRTMSMIRKTSIAGAAARKKLGFAAVVSVKRSVKTKYDFGVSFLEISFSVFMYTRIVHSPSHFIIR